MRTVYKYHIEIRDEQVLTVPANSKLIHVGLDPNKEPCIWVSLDPNVIGTELYTLFVVDTGNPIPEVARKYLGSFVQDSFMWHVYYTFN